MFSISMSLFLLACIDSQPRIFLANNSKVHPLDAPNQVLSTNFIQRNAVTERKVKGREQERERERCTREFWSVCAMKTLVTMARFPSISSVPRFALSSHVSTLFFFFFFFAGSDHSKFSEEEIRNGPFLCSIVSPSLFPLPSSRLRTADRASKKRLENS